MKYFVMHKIFICILTGFSFLLLILFILGIFFINEWILIGVILEIHLVFIVLLYRRVISVKLNFKFFKNPLALGSAVFISVVVLLFFAHLTYVVDFYGFPTVGDGINHGIVTSLLVYNEKITFSWEPLDPNIFMDQPLGFHSIAAYFTTLLGNYPADSIFILAAFLTALIFLAIFSLTYQVTKSFPLSVLGSLFTLWINITGNMETWVMGYFYNGPYPNIAGFVLVITSIILYMISRESEICYHKKMMILQGVIIITLMVTYPPFALIPISFLVLFNLIAKKNTILSIFKIIRHKNYNLISDYKNSNSVRNSFNLQKFLKKKKLFFIFVIGLIVLGSIFLNILSDTDNPIGNKFEKFYGREGYSVDLEYFQYNYAGIISILGTITSIGLIIFRRNISVGIIQLFLFCVVFGSLFFEPFSVYLPIRVGLLLTILSWVVFCVAINEFLKWKKISFMIFIIRLHSSKI